MHCSSFPPCSLCVEALISFPPAYSIPKGDFNLLLSTLRLLTIPPLPPSWLEEVPSFLTTSLDEERLFFLHNHLLPSKPLSDPLRWLSSYTKASPSWTPSKCLLKALRTSAARLRTKSSTCLVHHSSKCHRTLNFTPSPPHPVWPVGQG